MVQQPAERKFAIGGDNGVADPRGQFLISFSLPLWAKVQQLPQNSRVNGWGFSGQTLDVPVALWMWLMTVRLFSEWAATSFTISGLDPELGSRKVQQPWDSCNEMFQPSLWGLV